MRRRTGAPNTVLFLAALAIAVRLALPAIRTAQARGEAGEVVRAVEQAAMAEPPSHGGETFELHRRSWPLGEVLAPRIQGDAVAIITVRIPDPRVRRAFQRLARPAIWLEWDDSFAFLVPDA